MATSKVSINMYIEIDKTIAEGSTLKYDTPLDQAILQPCMYLTKVHAGPNAPNYIYMLNTCAV